MKDHTRDYATAAFRFYAKVGGAETYIRNLMADMQKQNGTGITAPTEAAVIAKERIMQIRSAEFADLNAVGKVLSILDYTENGKFIKRCIEIVYFKDVWRDMHKGDIEARVHIAELDIPASRRQVYRWLSRARRLFAEERGLRG